MVCGLLDIQIWKRADLKRLAKLVIKTTGVKEMAWEMVGYEKRKGVLGQVPGGFLLLIVLSIQGRGEKKRPRTETEKSSLRDERTPGGSRQVDVSERVEMLSLISTTKEPGERAHSTYLSSYTFIGVSISLLDLKAPFS